MPSKLALIFVAIVFISFVSASDCTPSYACSDWGKCTEGFQSRTCSDSKCRMKDITERQLCDKNKGCSPQIKCAPWSECIYTDKTDNVLKGEIKFGGYKTRTCSDATGCLESFIEENSCADSHTFETEKINECGSNFLLIKEDASGKTIGKINIDSWKEKKLDISFADNSEYCSACFNAVKDNGEENIDCGGKCKKCREEKEDSSTTILLSSWVLFGVFSFLAFIGVVRNGKK